MAIFGCTIHPSNTCLIVPQNYLLFTFLISFHFWFHHTLASVTGKIKIKSIHPTHHADTKETVFIKTFRFRIKVKAGPIEFKPTLFLGLKVIELVELILF